MHGLMFDNVDEFLFIAYDKDSIQSGMVYMDRDMNVYAVDPKDKSLVTNGGWLSAEEAHIEILQNPSRYDGISIVEDMIAIRISNKFKILHKNTLKDIFHAHDMCIGRIKKRSTQKT